MSGKTFLLFTLGAYAIATEIMAIAQPQTTNMYPVAIERLDFIATDQQTVFNTPVTARSQFVMLFRNGLLQTKEPNPATCTLNVNCGDYTTVQVNTAPAHQTMTFLQPLTGGDKIALVYWR